MNPFLIKGYVSPEYFCDRETETLNIISALENGRDILLFSLRRMGKTGLIRHLEYEFKSNSDVEFIYFDIYQTTQLREFVNVFGSAVVNALEKTPTKIIKQITSFMRSVMPTFTVNPVTMETELDFHIQNNEQAKISLNQIFDLINKSGKKVIVAIDEFQQISVYPEQNVEAILRTHIQQINNLNMLYSGSSKHLLTAMFAAKNRPFYQSAQPLDLGPISTEPYIQFIKVKFENKGMQIDEESIIFILEKLRFHTYYVQYLCNKLYGSNHKNIGIDIINQMLFEILKENESYYFRFRDLLTDNQFSLLKAIAKEDKVEKISADNFLKKHELPAASTVNSAVASLEKKEFIYKEESQIFVYDVFFNLWLKLLP